jgi:hypothetical protein
MLLLLNTFFFYSLYSSYYTWFRNRDAKYMAYCNSTISSVLVLLSENMINSYIALEFLSGFLLYDITHILLNIEMYKKNNAHIKWLAHHSITLIVTNSALPNTYPVITSGLLNMEFTIPIINAVWFIKYYKQPKIYENACKLFYLILYSYFRVYKLLNITMTHCYSTRDPACALFLVSLSYINLLWYSDILKNAYRTITTSLYKIAV